MDYRLMSPDDLKYERYEDSWKAAEIPAKQWLVVEQELNKIRKTKQFPAGIQAVVDAIKRTALKNPTLLEVGCSSGYFSELFRLAKINVRYHGCDYGQEFIKLAKEKFPNATFSLCDATKLPFKTDSFDIIMSGSCLLHIARYQAAIKESARVAKKFVIFHKTPVVHTIPTVYTVKRAYNVEMLEIQFNENELLKLFDKNGLTIVSIQSYASMTLSGLTEPIFYKDYLCIKQ